MVFFFLLYFPFVLINYDQSSSIKKKYIREKLIKFTFSFFFF